MLTTPAQLPSPVESQENNVSTNNNNNNDAASTDKRKPVRRDQEKRRQQNIKAQKKYRTLPASALQRLTPNLPLLTQHRF